MQIDLQERFVSSIRPSFRVRHLCGVWVALGVVFAPQRAPLQAQLAGIPPTTRQQFPTDPAASVPALP